ncbi:3-oxoacyl-[acyl-carrier-protein] synthase III C-terminal domain-containing protein [Sorangium sp. So ce296]|uniref:3-oxoacyl-ACP synthase III family protein n=1 Tax=Sorangium sp. So ce296 TaxID=3133296 RepID=UPI003F5F50AE
MNTSVGLRSLAVSFPRTIRTNDHWRQKFPDIVANAEQRSLAKLWAASSADAATMSAFEAEMQPYLSDTFRGTKERRVVQPGESARSYELIAARDALAAAAMKPSDVDLLISVSFWPDQMGFGNAAWLAKDLGLRCGAWNLETACSGGLVAMQTACSLVKAGQQRNVLVVVSCLYSRHVEESDTLSWFLGDGAGATVIGHTPEGFGLLGSKTLHTADTCEALIADAVPDPTFGQKIRLRLNRNPSSLKDTADEYIRHCCFGAAEAAGVSIRDIDFFVFNTPTAWFSAFGTRALGVDPARTVNAYPLYGNIGPALTTANMHLAASTGKIKRGDLVMIYSIGSVSSCGAMVMRWGDVALGPAPERPPAP